MEAAQLRLGGGGGLRGGGGREPRHISRAPFLHEARERLGHGRRRDCTATNGTRNLLARQIGAHQRKKLLLGQFVGAKEVEQHVAGEAAIHPLELRNGEDRAGHRRIGDDHAHPACLAA